MAGQTARSGNPGNGGQLLIFRKDVLIITLFLATVLSAFLGHGLIAAAIAVIVLFPVLLDFIQEFRAENAIDALRSMVAPKARVISDEMTCKT